MGFAGYWSGRLSNAAAPDGWVYATWQLDATSLTMNYATRDFSQRCEGLYSVTCEQDPVDVRRGTVRLSMSTEHVPSTACRPFQCPMHLISPRATVFDYNYTVSAKALHNRLRLNTTQLVLQCNGGEQQAHAVSYDFVRVRARPPTRHCVPPRSRENSHNGTRRVCRATLRPSPGSRTRCCTRCWDCLCSRGAGSFAPSASPQRARAEATSERAWWAPTPPPR